MQNTPEHKTVVVLGAPRSGTSLTSSLLHIIGVDMGRVSQSVKSNPKGDWEDVDFMNLNERILSATGAKRGGTTVPSPQAVRDAGKTFDEKIRTCVREKSENKICWGWKDPHTVLTLPLFLPYIKNPHGCCLSQSLRHRTLV